MGKGDKKTKRGKIIIGSFGVTRSARKKKRTIPVAVKAEPTSKKEVEETVIPSEKTAPRKTAKKVEEHVEIAEAKAKTTKTKKKVAEGEAEPAVSHEEPSEA